MKMYKLIDKLITAFTNNNIKGLIFIKEENIRHGQQNWKKKTKDLYYSYQYPIDVIKDTIEIQKMVLKEVEGNKETYNALVAFIKKQSEDMEYQEIEEEE